jgi:hypothetical protein
MPSKPSAKPTNQVLAYDRVGNDYQIWAMFARALFTASAILKREREREEAKLDRSGAVRVVPAEMFTVWIEPMLASFGIECLVKALWVKHGHEIARDGKYIPIIKNEGHRLVSLCQAVGIPLNNREQDTLKRISDIARTIGRYPIPKSASDPCGDWSTEDDQVVENFVLRLKRELRKKATT